jgi:hypothetical protein
LSTKNSVKFKVKGTVNFNGNDFESDRTTTVEIKDVGTTKVTVPEEAKKKVSCGATAITLLCTI